MEQRGGEAVLAGKVERADWRWRPTLATRTSHPSVCGAAAWSLLPR